MDVLHFVLVAPYVRLAIGQPELCGPRVSRYLLRQTDNLIVALFGANAPFDEDNFPDRAAMKAGSHVSIRHNLAIIEGLKKSGMFVLPIVKGLFCHAKENRNFLIGQAKQGKLAGCVVH